MLPNNTTYFLHLLRRLNRTSLQARLSKLNHQLIHSVRVLLCVAKRFYSTQGSEMHAGIVGQCYEESEKSMKIEMKVKGMERAIINVTNYYHLQSINIRIISLLNKRL